VLSTLGAVERIFSDIDSPQIWKIVCCASFEFASFVSEAAYLTHQVDDKNRFNRVSIRYCRVSRKKLDSIGTLSITLEADRALYSVFKLQKGEIV